jgi:superfamily II DNA/RNA helicase
MHATIHILVVEQPQGFSIDELDPILDDGIQQKIEKVFMALRQKELSFRPQTEKGQSGESAGAPP